ncbi:MAG: DUF1653 domain-containing protein [Candidatus Saccharibacteria bacterium]|jgi:hypothetical protein|nr:MAG: DUF1653 domain-containing protein [Candidatus Saccharibacteria bacterium]
MNEFADMPTLPLGTYEHYKGKRYQVLGIGRHTEANEYFVVYAPLYEHSGQPDIWLRPYAMFTSNVEVNGEIIPRFKAVEV